MASSLLGPRVTLWVASSLLGPQIDWAGSSLLGPQVDTLEGAFTAWSLGWLGRILIAWSSGWHDWEASSLLVSWLDLWEVVPNRRKLNHWELALKGLLGYWSVFCLSLLLPGCHGTAFSATFSFLGVLSHYRLKSKGIDHYTRELLKLWTQTIFPPCVFCLRHFVPVTEW